MLSARICLSETANLAGGSAAPASHTDTKATVNQPRSGRKILFFILNSGQRDFGAQENAPKMRIMFLRPTTQIRRKSPASASRLRLEALERWVLQDPATIARFRSGRGRCGEVEKYVRTSWLAGCEGQTTIGRSRKEQRESRSLPAKERARRSGLPRAEAGAPFRSRALCQERRNCSTGARDYN